MPQLSAILIFLANVDQKRRIGSRDSIAQLRRGQLTHLVELRECWELERARINVRLVRLQRLLDAVGQRQAEVVHQVDVIVARLARQPRIRSLLFSDRRLRMPSIVVRGKNQSLIRQREQLARDRVVLDAGVTAREIRATRSMDKQNVAGEY